MALLGTAAYTGTTPSYLPLSMFTPDKPEYELMKAYIKPKTVGLFATPVYMGDDKPAFTRPETRDFYLENELLYRKAIYASLLETQAKRYANTLNPRYVL